MSVRAKDRLGGRAAVVGIGATDFSKDSGRSELRLAVEAVRAALDDAGLAPADVDGLVTFTMDTSPEITVAQAVGIRRTVSTIVHRGPSGSCQHIPAFATAM